MLAKYSKLYDSIVLSNGIKLLVNYWKGQYYINPYWDISCDISNKGFTLLMYSDSIKGLCKNINTMVLGGVNFEQMKHYNIPLMVTHYSELK